IVGDPVQVGDAFLVGQRGPGRLGGDGLVHGSLHVLRRAERVPAYYLAGRGVLDLGRPVRRADTGEQGLTSLHPSLPRKNIKGSYCVTTRTEVAASSLSRRPGAITGVSVADAHIARQPAGVSHRWTARARPVSATSQRRMAGGMRRATQGPARLPTKRPMASGATAAQSTRVSRAK